MITAILAVSEGPVSRTVRIRAASLARARQLAGEGRDGVSVRLIGPATVEATAPRVRLPENTTAAGTSAA